MGIKNRYYRDWLYAHFRGCYLDVGRPSNVQLVCIDMMQHLKCSLPAHVRTLRDALRYFVQKILYFFDLNIGVHTVVASFDLGSPPVKKLVEHQKRYADRRCKPCKSTPSFHPKCEKNCAAKKPLKFGDGPFLDRFNLDKELPVSGADWMRFAGDSRNLRSEFYPLLMNEIIKTCPRKPGQTIIVSGLPVQTRKLEPHELLNDWGFIPKDEDEKVRVVQWLNEQMPVPLLDSLFRTVFIVRWLVPQNRILVTPCHEMEHNILEADSAVFFYSQFFPGANQMISINDSDAFPIGLLRAAEDTDTTTWLQLPYKIKDKKKNLERFGNRRPPSFEYINLTQMHKEILELPLFTTCGVQNPVATVVFLLSLGKTDFFQDFCPGIGYENIWATFLRGLDMYSHLVQWYAFDMKRDPRARRRIVLDETLWKIFVQNCYLDKFKQESLEDLEIYCSSRKSVNYPTDDIIQAWGRRATYMTGYWLNECRDQHIDPFEKVGGLSYYGYDPKEGVLDKVSPAQKEVDRVFKRHFYEKKKTLQVSETKKRRVAIEMEEEVNNLF